LVDISSDQGSERGLEEYAITECRLTSLIDHFQQSSVADLREWLNRQQFLQKVSPLRLCD